VFGINPTILRVRCSMRWNPWVFLVLPLTCQAGLCQPSVSSLEEGSSIFAERCAKCHGGRGEGLSSPITIAGPDLQAEHDPGDVMTAMEVGPSYMPSFADVLSVEQMQAVAAYVTQQLAVIPSRPGNIGEGGTLFREYCAPCHRTAVRGGALAFTGINAPALTNKSGAIIAGAIRWGPGPMPSFPPSVLSQKQVDSIVEYVKFVQHPPAPGGSPLNWYGPVAEGFVGWVILFACVAIAGWIEKGGKG
jgi:ubiquinol-cytochrome c reductase cytochrome c subunit